MHPVFYSFCWYNGIPGNDDYGAMSSWLLFASLGFYPNSGMDTFLIGSPRVANATLQLNSYFPTGNSGNKKKDEINPTITVTSHNQGPGQYFVQRLLVNGEEWTTPFIKRSVLAKGATLEFSLSSDPEDHGLC